MSVTQTIKLGGEGGEGGGYLLAIIMLRSNGETLLHDNSN